ncbi:DUF2860 family protein [Vibrio lentus]|nr:DUF2860 family protein [Vibrio lentus]
MFVPSMVYFNSDAEGGAPSFDSYGIELNYAKRIGRRGFVVTLDASDRQYDEAKPEEFMAKHVKRTNTALF